MVEIVVRHNVHCHDMHGISIDTSFNKLNKFIRATSNRYEDIITSTFPTGQFVMENIRYIWQSLERYLLLHRSIH